MDEKLQRQLILIESTYSTENNFSRMFAIALSGANDLFIMLITNTDNSINLIKL